MESKQNFGCNGNQIENLYKNILSNNSDSIPK